MNFCHLSDLSPIIPYLHGFYVTAMQKWFTGQNQLLQSVQDVQAWTTYSVVTLLCVH